MESKQYGQVNVQDERKQVSRITKMFKCSSYSLFVWFPTCHTLSHSIMEKRKKTDFWHGIQSESQQISIVLWNSSFSYWTGYSYKCLGWSQMYLSIPLENMTLFIFFFWGAAILDQKYYKWIWRNLDFQQRIFKHKNTEWVYKHMREKKTTTTNLCSLY